MRPAGRVSRCASRGAIWLGSGHHFLGRLQGHVWVIAFDTVDVPLQAREVNDVAVMIVGDMALVGGGEGVDLVARACDPTGGGELRRLESHGQAVFKLDPAARTSNCSAPTTP